MPKNKFFKRLIIAGAFILFLWVIYIFGREVKKRWIISVTLNSYHWEARYHEIEQIKPGKYKTIFLGNSLTEMFDLNAYFKDTTILNCGIVGDFSEGLVSRAELIARLKPTKLFIEIGINDIIEKISLTEICNNYNQLIEIIKKKSPETKIYIQSNLPLIINRPSILTGNEHVNNLVKMQNENLRQLSVKTGCIYVDVYTEFAKEKNKESLFIWDGIHLTDKAYQIWAEKVKGYLVSEIK